MTYVISSACVDVMHKSCVQECPVDCIYEGARALYINPDECVDCGACKLICDAGAIYHETDLPEDELQHLADNASFFTEFLPGRETPLVRRVAPPGSARWAPTRRWSPPCHRRPHRRSTAPQKRRSVGTMTAAGEPITILSESESWNLLASVALGRLVTSVDGEPEIFPVNFAVQHRTVLFRTAEGTKLVSAAINNRVLFEADDHHVAEGWSVIVEGTARTLRTDERWQKPSARSCCRGPRR